MIQPHEQQQADENGFRPGNHFRSSDVRSDDVVAPKRSAIVEPKGRPNNAHLHLLEDITDDERNRRADLAEEMFREIKRGAGNDG